MESEEKRFWVGITVFATLFGIGGYVVFEHTFWGWTFMVAGLGGLILGLLEKARKVHLPDALWMIALLATWALLGYDIYDRHHPSFGYDPSMAWDDKAPLEKIYNRRFSNETVALDGRHFISPVFDNVTFYYEGRGGVFLEDPTYTLHDGKMGTRLASRNKIVTMTMKLEDNLHKASGCPGYTINLGPDGKLDK
jgi:hypothetical protein